VNRFLLGCMTVALVICLSAPVALSENPPSATQKSFGESLRRFGIDHDRPSFRRACNRAAASEPRYALPVFYRGVLDEADEDWSAAELDFRGFLILEKNTDLSAKARRELDKLPGLIQEDSTPNGKLNRHYRQHLAFADLLQKQGFAKESLLEAGEAAQLAPSRWEAYAVASGIMLGQRQVGQANHFLEMARQRAPSSASPKIASLQAMIAAAGSQLPASQSGGAAPSAVTAARIREQLEQEKQRGLDTQPELDRTAPVAAPAIQGIVRDSEHRPVPGAAVTLQAWDGGILIARTDKTGAYRFYVSTVRPDSYTLSVKMNGSYGSASVGAIMLKQNESRTIDLTLDNAK
jgi:hypothetical protein